MITAGALGRYELLNEIGHGSMGTVYRARDSVLGREIAVKTMRTGPQADQEIRERFYREARACARLHHPNIVMIFDLGEHDSTAYIAMELLSGADWREAIRSQAGFTARARLRLIVQVLEGLAHAHHNGIVHRDIKPSNLFTHQNRTVKILDFGLARLPGSSLTIAGRVLGTPDYMAPEQIGDGACDSRSDLFSAAIVFFEFLTGVHPFRAPFVPRRIAEGEPEPLRGVDPAMPCLLEAVFRRAFEKDPARRYQTAEHFAAELRAAARELPDEGSAAGACGGRPALDPHPTPFLDTPVPPD